VLAVKGEREMAVEVDAGDGVVVVVVVVAVLVVVIANQRQVLSHSIYHRQVFHHSA
jgi:hypothetical protein